MYFHDEAVYKLFYVKTLYKLERFISRYPDILPKWNRVKKFWSYKEHGSIVLTELFQDSPIYEEIGFFDTYTLFLDFAMTTQYSSEETNINLSFLQFKQVFSTDEILTILKEQFDDAWSDYAIFMDRLEDELLLEWSYNNDVEDFVKEELVNDPAENVDY